MKNQKELNYIQLFFEELKNPRKLKLLSATLEVFQPVDCSGGRRGRFRSSSPPPSGRWRGEASQR